MEPVIDTVIVTSPIDGHEPSSPATPTAPLSPATPHEAHLSLTSVSSIALSEDDLDFRDLSSERVEPALQTPKVSAMSHTRKPSSLEILQNVWEPARQSTLFDASEVAPETPVPDSEDGTDVWARDSEHFASFEASITQDEIQSTLTDFTKSVSSANSSNYSGTPLRRSNSTEGSENEVDWQELERTELREKNDKDLPEGAVDESTAFLLARLEQENALLNNDPKAVNKTVTRLRSKSRPPSMAQLKKLVSQTDVPTARYSIISSMSLPEEPPAMTELEFWAALVQDYPSTAVRLPTLTTSKIRAGIPPPLRGVVWASMSGARDKRLEQSFQAHLGEKSPYEGIINKDVGRSFPGVELFREADGEGQRMLGRVLKCFSLHDKDIGYCQGLGFLVGPLLMNMGEQEAFCVLVRLMEHYSLRPSFLPSLSGLHMRIYQFSALSKQLLPTLSAHLTSMGVEPAYLSQWFLSCFAVTCPLAMLFRIYDVIFAEGANETVMRVALALMRRNEQKMLESTEFEEIMQLLLGRSLWDSYACNADELVDDFTSLGNVITNARLAELEKEFEAQSSEVVGERAGFLPEVQAAASRFLGRLWAPSHQASKSTNTLSPGGEQRDFRSAFLRRTPSKQSISTVNDGNEGSSCGSASLASTTPTENDADVRESTADSISVLSKTGSVRTSSLNLAVPQISKRQEDRDLHSQIEDLLTALSEMQREHAELAAMLQKEREERGEDHRVMRQLMKRLRPEQIESQKEDRRQTMPPPPREHSQPRSRPLSQPPQSRDDFAILVNQVSERLVSNPRHSATFESKAQIKSALARTREQLERAEARSRELTVLKEDAEAIVLTYSAESDDLRTEVEELRRRVNEEFKERQKLEHSIREYQARERSMARRSQMIRADSMGEVPQLARADTSPTGLARKASISSAPAGLRELKLGRRDSSSSMQSVRFSVRGPPSRESSAQTSPTQDIVTAGRTPQTVNHQRGLTVPSAGPGGSFASRGSSLATQQILATPEHEPVAEEALLLELVNAKTAEAQARQEVDELRRNLAVQKRKQDEALRVALAEGEAFKLQAEALRSEAEKKAAAEAAAAAEIVRRHMEAEKAASMAEDGSATTSTATDDKTTPTATTNSGWFWSRRTLSTTTASVVPRTT
ncbi:hypothetical protein AMS68_003173 [Peltaster fructicola]|uniref:Rab-GAP TBC domain-containing protein n=1 Tax=Peltaster fructicola TaxID=286661 RepID=A0A6H0XSK1_9PEZI|nr:hypothetical protein AMS68_003173 [Peltaster fructicola]